MLLLLVAVVAVVLLSRGAVAYATNQPPPPIITAGPTSSQAGIAGQVAAGTAIAQAASAIPVVGGALSSIINGLDAAHIQRAKEATNENVAVDNFIPGFDNYITQVVNAYNNGAATAAQAISMLDTLWHYYWQEVTPVIQPGRNGCNGGASIDYSPGHPPTESVSQSCSGSWGAACCIGVQVIGSGIGRLQQVIAAVDAGPPGTSAQSGIPPVVAGNYSNFTRAAYKVTVTKP